MESIAELLLPITEAAPVGVDLRYDPLYDKLREARREEADLPQGDWAIARKTADWPLVIRLANEALSRKTKDLQIAAWLTEAWLRREGISGLRQGLMLLHELLQRYWAEIYPLIEDGDAEARISSLEWVGKKLDLAVKGAPINQAGHSTIDYETAKTIPTREQAEQDEALAAVRREAVEHNRPTSEDFEAAFQQTSAEWYHALLEDLAGTLSELHDLNGFCNEHLSKKDEPLPPSFGPLRAALEEVQRTVAKLAARKPGFKAEPVDGMGAAASGSLPAGGASSVAAPAIAVSAAPAARAGGDPADWIAAAAARLRSERPLDPAAYLLLRGFRWGELRAGGERIDPRLLAAPSTETRTRLKGLLLDARWAELLEAGETVMAQPYGRGWLDLQRYVLSACDALGREYFAVGNAIRSQLRALLRDLPTLPSLTLMDDAPTANSETLVWLRDQQLLPEGNEAAVPAEVMTAGRRDAFDIAQDRLRAGDANGAMQLLMTVAGQEKSPRARFLRRSQAATIMVGAGLEAVALPVLKELLEQVDAHRLEEWEAGDLIADPLALLFQCAERLGSEEVDSKAIYTRVCRLDPMAAIRLGGPSSSRVDESE